MKELRPRGGKRTRVTSRRGVFNPEDNTRVKHTRLGVWDLYEEKEPELASIPGSSRLERFLSLKQSIPYLWMMLKDIGRIKSCWMLLMCYGVLVFVGSLIPALSIWYKGKMLKIVEMAVETRTVDKNILLNTTLGSIGCSLATRIISIAKNKVQRPLQTRLRRHYVSHIFRARARLDVPTFDDPAVQRQLDSVSSIGNTTVAWQTVNLVTSLGGVVIKVVSQVAVLAGVLSSQPDGVLLAVLSILPGLLQYFSSDPLGFKGIGVWAATTKNEHYIRIEGLKHVVSFPEHRQELVAGNMMSFILAMFSDATLHVGDYMNNFWQSVNDYNMHTFSFTSLLKDMSEHLPQLAFVLRAIHQPTSIPVSVASLSLIRENASDLSWMLFRFVEQTGSIADQLGTIRKLYEIRNIPNKVVDGTEPFPEDETKMKREGVGLEFRNVSFTYPGGNDYALRDVSFKMHPGQLCVIVGENGSGKSTILKLCVRLYDPQQGEILLDGRNIRELKLDDLRNAMSVLFQNFTHFPLSIRDNIILGNPSLASDDAKIRLAAELGGSTNFIERLPEGFDTYLDRPVQDLYSGLPEGTKTLFGRPVDYQGVRSAGGMASGTTGLSGGQMQRLALSRMFMRSFVSDDSQVGLLLFDEPSASLDPTAEHDLFRRLRELRGNKTMIFSSHRFGNLTRHADMILYMSDSRIVESGTHEELLKREGDYARIWMLQAQAFL
ncbi:P-loop containing nucleoside triphosphate hydrolase protein [Irpex rosettiformis]|uniref:P-loop containing nucleoside triphosphate hydrolase protein n=1 Tax=Irpex rosettiformis TaxID=378272 RepID=A0ACB8U6J7_9APHY|nr:P-loop containing nucleoside triphosphate hydrolase protein [Irpex rosettiformis]